MNAGAGEPGVGDRYGDARLRITALLARSLTGGIPDDVFVDLDEG